MGLTVVVRCPNCKYTATGRLGMGEEGLGDAYEGAATQELKEEHPNHSHSSGWRFTHTANWKREEEGWWAQLARRE